MAIESANELRSAINKLSTELEAKKKALASLESYSHEQKLAIRLYDAYYVKTDRDGEWYYELKEGNHDWNGRVHREMLAKVARLNNLEFTFGMPGAEKIIAILEAMRGLG